MRRSFLQLPSWILAGRLGLELVGTTTMLSGCMSPIGLMAMGLADREDRMEWNMDKVAGHSLTLLDPDKTEWLQFSRDGTVDATLGDKTSTYHWKIEKGTLEIYDQKTLVEEFRLASLNESTAVMTNKAGKFVKYKYR